jgi:hypothetical protein
MMKIGVWALTFAVLVFCGLGAVHGAEAQAVKLPSDIFRYKVPDLGVTAPILVDLGLEPDVLVKAKVLVAEGEAASKAWHEANDEKLAKLYKDQREARAQKDNDTGNALGKEINALLDARAEDMEKRRAAVLALLPDDETRVKAKAEFFFRSLYAMWATSEFFKVQLSQKQVAAMRVLCLEAVKAVPEKRLLTQQDMAPTGCEVLREAFTKVLSPDQAVQAFEKLAKRDKRTWPADQAPQPMQ